MPDEPEYEFDDEVQDSGDESAVTAGEAAADEFVGTDKIYQNFAYGTHEPYAWPEGSNEERIAALTSRYLTVPGLSSSMAPPTGTDEDDDKD